MLPQAFSLSDRAININKINAERQNDQRHRASSHVKTYRDIGFRRVSSNVYEAAQGYRLSLSQRESCICHGRCIWKVEEEDDWDPNIVDMVNKENVARFPFVVRFDGERS